MAAYRRRAVVRPRNRPCNGHDYAAAARTRWFRKPARQMDRAISTRGVLDGTDRRRRVSSRVTRRGQICRDATNELTNGLVKPLLEIENAIITPPYAVERFRFGNGILLAEHIRTAGRAVAGLPSSCAAQRR